MPGWRPVGILDHRRSRSYGRHRRSFGGGTGVVSPKASEPTIASVDLASDSAVAEIGEACRRDGFFFAFHHGVPTGLVSPAFEETLRFYARPAHEKKSLAADVRSQFLGYRSVGQERSTSHAGGEACEQYRIGRTTGTLASGRPTDVYHEPFRRTADGYPSR
ncbi:hypothetical protein D7231_12845 [Streptomyces klenkii]|uniref:Non-haem dioxygenase N-terminal domain-containing protein n=1 Tax=Streptomyces klenkii TaxID=1420899 RepID=A0A3B0BQ42_9ACTN|nr:hypothetical protein D7231_12845 [Streptomyces klenkii]